jgi:hypothetical protein
MARELGDHWLDHVGRGFWFAIGFTPAFVVVVALITLVVDQLQQQRYEVVMRDSTRVLRQSMPQIVSPISPPVQNHAPARIAKIGPADMSSEKQRERECSVLMLRYIDNQDPAIKKQMYDVCPK